eukprot:1933376-Alexandrium_andersonii.AAC.1
MSASLVGSEMCIRDSSEAEAVDCFIATKGPDRGCHDRLNRVHQGTRLRILAQSHWPESTDHNKTVMAMIRTVEDERRAPLDPLVERWLLRPLDRAGRA